MTVYQVQYILIIDSDCPESRQLFNKGPGFTEQRTNTKNEIYASLNEMIVLLNLLYENDGHYARKSEGAFIHIRSYRCLKSEVVEELRVRLR